MPLQRRAEGAYSGGGYRHRDEGRSSQLFSLPRFVRRHFLEARRFALTAVQTKSSMAEALSAKEIVREGKVASRFQPRLISLLD